MEFQTLGAQAAADFFRALLADVLDELLNQVPVGYLDDTSAAEKVKQSLRNISNMYKNGLRYASSNYRSDWDDPANRCAYVFVYLMQHCHLVYCSLQSSDVSSIWRSKNHLRVCSIGGGPGSDLVGLTTFLRDSNIFPPSLECLVLDLFPDWKQTWNTIYGHLPETFSVTYRKCDLVRDTRLQSEKSLQFIQHADLLTFVKSFSAVAAFYRADSSRGKFLRSILREIKAGCFVLFIDNAHAHDTQFQQDFASQAGLELVSEFRGKPTLPMGQYPFTIKRYCRLLDFSPMRSCDVVIQLFCRKKSVNTNRAVISEIKPPQVGPSYTSRGISFNQTSVPTSRNLSSQITRPRSPPRPYHAPQTSSSGISQGIVSKQDTSSQAPPPRNVPRSSHPSMSTYHDVSSYCASQPRALSRRPEDAYGPGLPRVENRDDDNRQLNCCSQCVIL